MAQQAVGQKSSEDSEIAVDFLHKLNQKHYGPLLKEIIRNERLRGDEFDRQPVTVPPTEFLPGWPVNLTEAHKVANDYKTFQNQIRQEQELKFRDRKSVV